MDELYRGENCDGGQCEDSVIMDKIVGNPIYNYQMLKRMLLNWKSLEDALKKIDTKGNALSEAEGREQLGNFNLYTF